MAKNDRTKLGLEIETGLREAIAHRKGEMALETRVVDVMPPARIKEIRKTVAGSTKAFEKRFGVPARTLEGWEQGRKLGVADRVLMTVIARNPRAVEEALLPQERMAPGKAAPAIAEDRLNRRAKAKLAPTGGSNDSAYAVREGDTGAFKSGQGGGAGRSKTPAKSA